MLLLISLALWPEVKQLACSFVNEGKLSLLAAPKSPNSEIRKLWSDISALNRNKLLLLQIAQTD